MRNRHLLAAPRGGYVEVPHPRRTREIIKGSGGSGMRIMLATPPDVKRIPASQLSALAYRLGKQLQTCVHRIGLSEGADAIQHESDVVGCHSSDNIR